MSNIVDKTYSSQHLYARHDRSSRGVIAAGAIRSPQNIQLASASRTLQLTSQRLVIGLGSEQPVKAALRPCCFETVPNPPFTRHPPSLLAPTGENNPISVALSMVLKNLPGQLDAAEAHFDQSERTCQLRAINLRADTKYCKFTLFHSAIHLPRTLGRHCDRGSSSCSETL